MQETSLSRNFGTMITADAGQRLADFSGASALEHVRRSGVLVLRGFESSLDEFERFTQSVATRFIHNGNDSREILGDEGRTRSVTPGKNFIGPHSEFSYTPFRPDLLFFHCIRPAASGGESLFWDGRRLWDEMPDEIRNLFLARRINFKYTNLDIDFFSQFVGQASQAGICRFLDSVPGLLYTLRDGRLNIDYNATAQVRSALDGALSFSNSIAVLPETAFDDGTSLSPAIRGELLDLALRETVKIDALAGDVMVVDNWRAMHGRAAFDDPLRKMCIRMGYVGGHVEEIDDEEFEEVEY